MPYSREALSASVDGAPIVVAAIAAPGTLIHTCESGQRIIDEPQLLAANVTGIAATLTVLWGGTTDPASAIVKSYVIAAYAANVPVTSGQILRNGLTIHAYSDTANAINLSGGVIRTQ